MKPVQGGAFDDSSSAPAWTTRLRRRARPPAGAHDARDARHGRGARDNELGIAVDVYSNEQPWALRLQSQSCGNHAGRGPQSRRTNREAVAARRLIRKEYPMADLNAVIAVFAEHQGTEGDVKKLADAGIDMKHLSVVGKGYHTDEKVVGF